MKTLIAYATKHGSTERCALLLSEKLNGEVDLHNLKEEKACELEQYDNIIIGGSIYMGQIQKKVKEFCIKNLPVMKGKKIGVFICCMNKGEGANKQIENSFSQELLKKATAKEVFGGEFIFKKMNFFERFIIKKVAKTTADTSAFSEESINRFVELMNKA